MKRSSIAVGAAAVAISALTWAPRARADEEATQSSTGSVTREETALRVKRTPNEDLIVGGTFLFGLSYGAGAIAAWQSPLTVDDKLYVPLVGPWLDLANRPGCGNGAQRPSCEMEDTNRVLLAADGVLQGLGVLQVLGGILFPKEEVVMVRVGRNVEIAPQAGPSAMGIAAHGKF